MAKRCVILPRTATEPSPSGPSGRTAHRRCGRAFGGVATRRLRLARPPARAAGTAVGCVCRSARQHRDRCRLPLLRDAQWWRELGDPALDPLIEWALADPPSLAAAAAARLARAATATDTAQATQGPQAGLGQDLSRQRYTEHGLYAPPRAGHVHNSGNLQANASLELDFFGRHDAALQAAQRRPARAHRG